MSAATKEATTWRVLAPCIGVWGKRGTLATFYAGDKFSTWTTVDGSVDIPTEETVGRLLDERSIEAA